MMSTLTQYFKRLAHSRSRRRLAVPKSTKLKFTDPSTDLVSNSDPENAKSTGSVPALQEPQHKVTHLYKGRKVMKFDSKRSRSHIEKMILIRSCSKTRRREGKILLEGKKLITDAIVQGKVEPIAFYSWNAENFLEVPAAGVTSSVNFFILEKRDYLRLTLLETPQPVIALCSYVSWKDVGNILPDDTKYLFASSEVCDLSYDQIEWSDDVVESNFDSWSMFDDSDFQDDHSDTGTASGLESNQDQSNKLAVKSEPSSVGLVISNEGWGMSDAAANAMEKLGGCSVHVPMSESVNSLNCSIAASVIMWELRRKFRMKLSKLNEPF